MGQFVDLVDKVKKYFGFTPLELRSLAIAILVLAFIVSYNDWGPGDSFDLTFGLFNFFNAVLIVALSMLVHISVQRIWSLGTGYRLDAFPEGGGLTELAKRLGDERFIMTRLCDLLKLLPLSAR